MELKTNKPQLLELIGEGSFGQIYKARWKDKIYAAKIVPREKWENSLLFECMINKSFSCPYLNLADKILINQNYIILSELAVADFPTYQKTHSFSLSTFWQWVYQLLTAIYTLHSVGIIHGDIKAKNILIMKDGNLKLIDYSCSCFIGFKSKNTYTYTHRAPEIWQNKNWNGTADIWALGCTLFEMVSGHLLFPAQKKHNLQDRVLACIDDYFIFRGLEPISKISIDHYSPHFNDLLDKKEYKLIKMMIEDCLVMDRLSSKQLLEKYFFSFPVNNFILKTPTYPIIINFKKYLDMENNFPELNKAIEILISRLPPKEQNEQNILALISLVNKLLNIKIKNENLDEDKVCMILDFQLYFKI